LLHSPSRSGADQAAALDKSPLEVGDVSDLVVDGADMEVEQADREVEGPYREELVGGSSSEREAAWEEMGRRVP
jgi:hypothetical protein